MTASAPVSFYSVDDAYEPEKSIGFLMRSMIKSNKSERDARLAGHGYADEHWVPMFKLQREGSCTLDGLVNELGLDRDAMVRTLAFLQADGAVSQTVLDGKPAFALTTKGLALGAVVQQVLVDVANHNLRGFSDAEFSTLVALLQKMYRNTALGQAA